VTIRLLDPPLHEFIPHSDEEIAEVAKAAGADPSKLRARAIALAEANPMLGHRGCRLGINFTPKSTRWQARAILEAAIDIEMRAVNAFALEIMLALIGFKSELDFLTARIAAVAMRSRERGRSGLFDRNHDRTAAAALMPARSPKRPSFSASARMI